MKSSVGRKQEWMVRWVGKALKYIGCWASDWIEPLVTTDGDHQKKNKEKKVNEKLNKTKKKNELTRSPVLSGFRSLACLPSSFCVSTLVKTSNERRNGKLPLALRPACCLPCISNDLVCLTCCCLPASLLFPNWAELSCWALHPLFRCNSIRFNLAFLKWQF